MLVTSGGELVFANKAASACLNLPIPLPPGLLLGDLAGMPGEQVRSFLRLCTRSRHWIPIALNMPAGSAQRMMCRGAALNPGERPVLVALRLERHTEAVSSFVRLNERLDSLTRELREKQRTEEELQRLHEALISARDHALAANHSKTVLLDKICAAFRATLTPLLESAGEAAARLHSAGEVELAGELQRSDSETRQLLDSLEHFLQSAGARTEKIGLDLEAVRVSDLMDEVVERILPLALAGGNAVEVNCPPGAGTIHTDGHKLRQVLVSLLSHSCSTTVQGHVRLRVTLPQPAIGGNGQAIFTVADTGRGFAPEEIPGLFSACDPAPAATATAGSAVAAHALSLAATQRLVHMLGGTIRVQSRPGRGTRFTVTLPTPCTCLD